VVVVIFLICATVYPIFQVAHDATRTKTGANRVGALTGVWTAGETLGLALGPAIYALVLTIGFTAPPPVAVSRNRRRRCSRSPGDSRWCRRC
jgi:hypothetical protein